MAAKKPRKRAVVLCDAPVTVDATTDPKVLKQLLARAERMTKMHKVQSAKAKKAAKKARKRAPQKSNATKRPRRRGRWRAMTS